MQVSAPPAPRNPKLLPSPDADQTLDPLSFGRLWPETMAIARRHAELIVPVAAAFLFLPQLLFNRHLGDALPKELFSGERALGDVFALALLLTVSLVGQLAVASVAMDDGTRGRTLGEILKRSLALLAPAIAATLIQGIGVGFGLLLFVIPGLWLLARLITIIPLIATDVADPVDAIKASWALTKGRALRIFGLLSVLILGFILISLGVSGLGSAVGVISTVAVGSPAEGWGIGRWFFELLAAATSATVGVIYLCFISSLTRALQQNPLERG